MEHKIFAKWVIKQLSNNELKSQLQKAFEFEDGKGDVLDFIKNKVLKDDINSDIFYRACENIKLKYSDILFYLVYGYEQITLKQIVLYNAEFISMQKELGIEKDNILDSTAIKFIDLEDDKEDNELISYLFDKTNNFNDFIEFYYSNIRDIKVLFSITNTSNLKELEIFFNQYKKGN